jgi:hypothetical protein
MTDLPRIYVVCQAEYDAQGPCAAFTDPEIAEQHAADMRVEHHGDFQVIPLPLVDHLPTRAAKHLRQGLLRRDGVVEAEQSWTVEHWDYDLPAEPVVALHGHRDDTTRIHVAAASPEAAVATFWGAVESLRVLGE